MSTDPKKNEEVKEENLEEVAGGRLPPIASGDEGEVTGSTDRPSDRTTYPV